LFWEAVQENDHRPVRRPRISDIEHEFAMSELFHRLTVSRGHAPASIARFAEQRSSGWSVMSEEHRWQSLATKAIHAGFRPDPGTGAVNAPIYASSTFAQDGVGGLRGGYEYARSGNPTRTALEASLAAVEEATFGRAFSSGMAATDCALRAVLRPGDHVVIPDDAYGGTFGLIDKVFTNWGITYTAVAMRHSRHHIAADV
jgi:hypothetical protein